MARRTRQHYIDANELRDALLESQLAGEPTVKLCQLLRLLISHFLGGPRWSGYDATTREDLASASFLKALKNVRNFSPSKGSAFSYVSLICECACKDYLTKHYQQRNILSEVRTLKRDEWLGSVPAYVRVSRKNGRNTPPLGTEGGGGQGKPEGGGDTGLVGNWVSHGEQS